MGRIDRRVNHNVRPECHCQLSSARGEIGGDNRVNSFDIECSNDREFDGPTPDVNSIFKWFWRTFGATKPSPAELS